MIIMRVQLYKIQVMAANSGLTLFTKLALIRIKQKYIHS